MNQRLEIFAPFAKGQIDVENRMVYGVAQLDDGKPDLQGDVVEWGGTRRAFNKWFHGINEGNVREMHRRDQAVGRAIILKPLDAHKQMLVGVHVSKGAESTWQKVLDGTLKAFSIGGHSTLSKREFDSKLGRVVNKVKDYVLTELSLVDVPANPKCKILGIQKNHIEPGLTGGHRKAEIMENPALEAVREMAKTVKPDEELILVKRADIEVRESEDGKGEKTLVLKNDAEVSEPLNGSDLQAIDEAVEEAITKGAGGTDVGEQIKAIFKSVATLCTSVGLNAANEFKTATEPEGDPLNKGVSLDQIREIADASADAKYEALSKSIEALTEKIDAGPPAARRGGTADPQARPIRKLGEPGGDIDDPDREKLEKRLEVLHQKRGDLLAKKGAGQDWTPQEYVEAKAVGEEIDQVEVAIAGRGVALVER